MVDTYDLNAFLLVKQIDSTNVLELLRSNGFFSKVFPAISTTNKEPVIIIGIQAETLEQGKDILEKANIKIIDSGALDGNILRGFYEDTGN